MRCVKRCAVTPQPPVLKQLLLQVSMTHCVLYKRTKTSDKFHDITKAVAFHTTKDCASILTMDETDFVQLLKTLNLRRLSCNYITREAPKIYINVKASLAAWQKRVTTCWPPKCGPARPTNPIRIRMTVDFMEDLTMTSACVQTSFFPQDHTRENFEALH